MGQRMILCGGLQSGGSTIVSWCFLQRSDTNGELDMANDVLRVCFEAARRPVVWCKMTVGSFRWVDVAAVYRDLGWRPEPLLVVRDVRRALASLVNKPYGFNGTMAEQPPLRLRLLRFLQDWELFRAEGWPVLRYETFVAEPRAELLRVSSAVGLPWDEAMMDWPKSIANVAYVHESVNSSFASSLGVSTLTDALGRFASADSPVVLPEAELDWLESTFAEYNLVLGYPAHVDRTAAIAGGLPPPSYEGSGRQWYVQEVERLSRDGGFES
jgi:hypothetical protein